MQLDAYAWSFAHQAIKPDRSFYDNVCGMLMCASNQALMVGDTPSADVDGPRLAGMQSVLLDRTQVYNTEQNISSLASLLNML
ncbi:HAD family hydrolase [Massilia solisilvae]|uniref:HAD family hydrolase n=1 Tax=Massilia solisilvae TaxID=1811225 RepID=UPI00351D8F70